MPEQLFPLIKRYTERLSRTDIHHLATEFSVERSDTKEILRLCGYYSCRGRKDICI